MNKEALVVIDFINEMTSPSGKISVARGYPSFLEENAVVGRLNMAIEDAVRAGRLVVFVGLAFEKDWRDQPKSSKIFGRAHEFGVLQLGTWSTEMLDAVRVPADSISIRKTRVSAFFGTSLESLLRNAGVDTVILAGVATDLAVEAAARDAHDRDFRVQVLAGACGAANMVDHESALSTMSKFAEILD